FSLHLDQFAYAELLVVGSLGQAKDAPARGIRARLQEAPDRVERYIAGIDPPPYWRMVALRYPQMLRYVQSKTRTGTQGDIAVINAALPLESVHNLVFATEMALQSSPGVVAGTSMHDSPPTAPRDFAELLTCRFTIRFPQDSLEFAMQNIETEVRDRFPNLAFPFAIRILGGDLEKNGITRNQQIREFDQQDRPLAEILTAMVLKANPKATTDPRDPSQQLIWAIGPSPEGADHGAILITTRDAAAQRGYEVSATFRSE
ncbi:MAG: hypothetical protein JJ992_04855, partial [Planctomycetes bacterium]|nr:hypothetical protein [Planctomycetota bacterium]